MAAPSSYVRVDNALAGNEKILDVDDDLYLEVAGLYVFTLGKCDQNNTDGFISRGAIIGKRGLAPGREDLLDEMLRVGLLKRIEGGDMLHIEDYLEWQRSANEKLSASDRARIAANARHAAAHAETHTDTPAPTLAEQASIESKEREQDLRAREERPEAKLITGDTSLPACMTQTLELVDPPYTGTCIGYINHRCEQQFGTLLSHSERAELFSAIHEGCLHDCTGEHPQLCALLIARDLERVGKAKFATSTLWRKTIREDRMEVRRVNRS